MTLRALESYIQIDHRESPGFDAQMASRLGLGRHGVGSVNYESAIVHCCMCSRGVLLRPERSRERAFCRYCNSYMCDVCATAVANGAPHVPLAKVFDDALEAILRADQIGAGSPLILLPLTSRGQSHEPMVKRGPDVDAGRGRRCGGHDG